MKTEMLNQVIACYGYEHPVTITIARLVDNDTIDINDLQVIINALLASPIEDQPNPKKKNIDKP